MNKFYLKLDIVKSAHDKHDEGDEFYVEGYAATTDLDRQGDIIVRPALEKATEDLLETGDTVFYNHDYSRAIGRLVEASVDDKGLHVKAIISTTEEELRTKIREGIIKRFSIGGQLGPTTKLPREEAQRVLDIVVPESIPEVSVIESLELYEVSLVGLPANPEARVENIVTKSLTEVIQEVRNEVDKSQKEEVQEMKEVIQEKDEEKKQTLEDIKDAQENAEIQKDEETSKLETDPTDLTSDKEEVTGDEIKELVDEDETKEADKYPYYYYYGKNAKAIKEALDKLAKGQEKILDAISKLTDAIKEKVKTIEVENAEKKSFVKTDDEIESKKSVDEQFVDYIKS